ncbi:MAG: sodium:calcium antiporter, partial [candidate division WOR-3 bacterium]
MLHVIITILGLACAGAGGELFVRGVVRFARWLRLPTAIIGATVAAFATSSPELTVAIGAAASGAPQISFGDVLGSNVVNITLVLALGLVLSAHGLIQDASGRNAWFALLAPIATGFMVLDRVVSRFEGLLLITGFALWLWATIREALRGSGEAIDEPSRSLRQSGLGEGIIGLVLLIAAGRLVVLGAKGIATALGMDEFIVGATFVAIGTSVPELATIIIAGRRGHVEIGLGMMLGSNIFNTLLIVGLVALIAPIPVARLEVLPALVWGVLSVAVVLPSRRERVGRARAIPLFAI